MGFLVEPSVDPEPVPAPPAPPRTFAEQPYQATMHAQRRTATSTLRYTVLMTGGFIGAPMVFPRLRELGHFSLRHSVVVSIAVVLTMLLATWVYHRHGPRTVAYRRAWLLESGTCHVALMSLAAVGHENGFPWWMLYLLQVFLIALEDSVTAWPKLLFAGGPLALAVAQAVQGDTYSSGWALIFGACGLQMTVELQKIGRRLSAEALERETLSAQLATMKAREERTRIARDLHDGLAAELTALNFRVDSLGRMQRSLDPGSHDAFGEIGERVQQALSELRSVVWAMRAPSQSWAEAMEYLERRCAELCGDGVQLRFEAHDTTGRDEPLSGALRMTLARVILEAVRNAVRHGRPKNVIVRLERGDELRLFVEDDGVGLSAPASRGEGTGLESMRARIELLGGTMQVESHLGRTRIASVLPSKSASA